MFGFFFGTACLIGLFWFMRRRRFGYHTYYGMPRRGWRRQGGRRFVLNRMFERLDTTPGQEKVIRGAVDEFVDETKHLRGELSQSRKDIGEALRGDSLDEGILAEVFVRHDDALGEVRRAAIGVLAKAHDALDDVQRKRLADILENHGGWRSWNRYREEPSWD